jgi:hypothetical protein
LPTKDCISLFTKDRKTTAIEFDPGNVQLIKRLFKNCFRITKIANAGTANNLKKTKIHNS